MKKCRDRALPSFLCLQFSIIVSLLYFITCYAYGIMANTYSVSLHLQPALTLIFGWWEEGMNWKVEWRCALRDNGGQCVVSSGILEMRELPADSLVSPQIVGY